ncbi:non-homologous end joining protein Ku [Pseudomonas sp. EA_35y_Pfl2_R111]|uniref:non-homologous end joining protein Ku n=1 Tax=Pseudomonas sp. EA_35y_Pfl2_R111 TaxID=3088689 RepID=UPI0030D7264E
MPRAIWKGAISFGLVHIPVALTSATMTQGVDFDWLDKRSMEPVGYKRVNKATGKEVSKENIVKGVAYEKGRYVVLSAEEIRAAHPEATQTIDIFAFVDSEQIPLQHIDTPYYLAPDRRGEKVYALLREALSSTNKVALAHVVLHTKQHLAALMPLESALVLVMLRWPSEVRSLASLELGAAVSKPKLAKSELDMAKRLIKDMSGDWQPDEYIDEFQNRIMELVERKAKAGKIEVVDRVEGEDSRRSADVIDLTELLKRSLGGKPASKTTDKSSGSRKPAAKTKRN